MSAKITLCDNVMRIAAYSSQNATLDSMFDLDI